MSSPMLDPNDHFQEFQNSIERACYSLSDLEWSELEKFLDNFPTDIEKVDFLAVVAKLPNNGTENGIITDPARHNRNQNELLTPLRRKQSILLSKHFDVQIILQKANQIVDDRKAISYLIGVLREYDNYHSCKINNQYSPEEFNFCKRIDNEIEYRKSLRDSNFDGRITQIMGDFYQNNGQAGAIGPNSSTSDMTFNQISNQFREQIDLSALAKELLALRQEMIKKATDAEHYIAIAEVAKAEETAKNDDGPRTIKHLKLAGKWAFDVATKVGIALAAKAIGMQINL